MPPERIQRELGRAAKAGATRWLLINTANVRPVTMTTRMAMELAWNPKQWIAPNSTESDKYLDRWSREEFGAPAAAGIAEFYKAYFAAPARYGPAEDATAGDNFYQTAAKNFLLMALEGDSAMMARLHGRIQFTDLTDLTGKLLEACRSADARWLKAQALADKVKPLVPKDRLDFFQGTIQTQVHLHLHFNRMMVNLAEMTQASDKNVKIAKLKAAIQEGEQASAALGAAEYGKWKGFYTEGDWLLDTPRTLALARTYLDSLEGDHPRERHRLRLLPHHRIPRHAGDPISVGAPTPAWRSPESGSGYPHKKRCLCREPPRSSAGAPASTAVPHPRYW